MNIIVPPGGNTKLGPRVAPDKFWKHVDKAGPVPAHRPYLGPCWVWTAGKDTYGYGAIHSGSKTLKAHRLSLELAGVDVPADKKVCHHCDNPACVRPLHLFIGDQKANMIDAAQKGRSTAGEAHANAKLTTEDVGVIRRVQAAGGRESDIARLFGVSPVTVNDIVHRRRWKHVS